MKNILAKSETLLIVITVMVIYCIQYYHWNGGYTDPDDYMHALRTIDFINTPTLFEHKFMLTDYPFGEVLHWTRLFDIIMTLCILPFYFSEPLQTAVFYGGLLLTPLFFLLTLICVEKWGKTELDINGRIFLYLLLIFNPDLSHTYTLAHPDHHALILFLAAAQILWLNKFINDKQLKQIIISAVICGLSLWLAAEGIFLYTAELMFLYCRYLFFSSDKKILSTFTLSYALTICVFWLINPPYQGWSYIDNGRISVFYVIIAFYVWIALEITGKICRTKILQTSFLAFAAVILIAAFYYAGLLDNPFNESIKIAFTSRISELKSGFNFRLMAFPMIAFFCLYGLLQNKYENGKILMFAIFLIVYTGLTVYARRFCGYSVLYTMSIIMLRLKYLHLKNLTYCGIIILLIALNPLAYYFDDLISNEEERNNKINFDVNILNYINFPQGAVVSDIFISPYILWYSERPTVASPYHRNIEGITDNHEILFSNNEQKVKELLIKHQVKAIILPIADESNTYYNAPSRNCDKLYGQIMACNTRYPWLKKVYRNESLAIFAVHLE